MIESLGMHAFDREKISIFGDDHEFNEKFQTPAI